MGGLQHRMSKCNGTWPHECDSDGRCIPVFATEAPLTEPSGRPTRGRPPSTTSAEVSRTAFALFAERGFEATTMDDIAGTLAIGRRTVFRYFPSKNDLVWGDFAWVLDRLRMEFAATDPQAPLMEALREAVVASNTYPDEELPELRIRLTLITRTPALQAHSMLRYAEWRAVVAEFAARRLRRRPEDLEPEAIGYAALAASITAFTHWVDHPDRDLLELLHRSYRMLASGFDVPLRRNRPCGI
jgi:mycofactocin system transcriptional regulator